MTRTRSIFFILLICLITLGLFSCRLANAMMFNLDYEFSGASNPEGDPPWLRATFTDITGGVHLLMEDIGLVNDEHVKSWYFNLDPSLDSNSLTFTYIDGVTADVSTGNDQFKADGDGYFDILFEFDGHNFGVESYSEFFITSTDPIIEMSFNFCSIKNGEYTQHGTAAHVGGIGPNGEDSGWIAGLDPPTVVPEPSSMTLLILGIIGLSGSFFIKKRV